MPNIEITIDDAIYIQDILEWAQNDNEDVLNPYKYINSRNNSISKVEFLHYIKIILSISPSVLIRPHPSVFSYRKTQYLEKYLAKGGYRAEFDKLNEILEEEKRRKEIELEGLQTTIETSKQAILLAKESNDIAKSSDRKAGRGNLIAVISIVLAAIAIIISLVK